MSFTVNTQKRDGMEPITITFRITPHCNHPKFVEDCMWCQAAQHKYRLMIEEITDYHAMTKVDVIHATNSLTEEK